MARALLLNIIRDFQNRILGLNAMCFSGSHYTSTGKALQLSLAKQKGQNEKNRTVSKTVSRRSKLSKC